MNVEWTEVCRSGGCDNCDEAAAEDDVIWVDLNRRKTFQICKKCALVLLEKLATKVGVKIAAKA